MSEVDKDKLVERFVRYDAIEAEVAEYKAKIENLLHERSNVVEAMLEANGGSKQIVRKGTVMSIMKRGETFFFKGAKVSSDITRID